MLGKLQFGVFELDRDTLELRKQGVPVRLQEQPLRVLAALMERPGQIVTREELRARIWGEDTFVDFEQSLNKAVNRLREALNDEAGQPRYVETVPRRGYRFIAPVTGLEPPAPTPLPASISGDGPGDHEAHRSRVTAKVLLVAGVLLIMAIAAVLFWRRPEKHWPPEPKHVTAAALCCPRLSPDGKLLAYTSLAGGSTRIWVQQTAGGLPVPVTTGGAEIGEDFSPDGSHIAFVGKEGIYVAPIFSGAPKLLAKGGAYPHFSPDGQLILYWEGATSNAMTVSVDSGERVSLNLNRDFHVLSPPIWSANGEEVVFYGGLRRQPDKPYEWWVAPLKTGEPKPLLLPASQQNSTWLIGVCAWVHSKDGNEWIIYSLGNGDAWKLFRVRVSAEGQVNGEPEQIAAGAGYLGYSVSVSQDGTLVYPTDSLTQSLFEIPIGNRGQKLGATFQIPLPEGSSYVSPSLSRDGRWMTYNASVPGKSNVIVRKDFVSGADLILDEAGRQPGWGGETIISPDGSKVVLERACKSGQWSFGDPVPCTFVIPAAGGELKQVCEFCTPRGFSANGSVLLIQRYTGREDFKPPDWISAVDLSSGIEKKFLSSPRQALYHAFFSWDDRWVVFKTEDQNRLTAQILIAPVRSGAAGKEADWIAITDGRYYDDKPQFSSDGNTVYFTSNRDGYWCIWAQQLNPVTKRPVTGPRAYEHFHYNSLLQPYLGNNSSSSDLSVARDKMVISLPQAGHDIWMTRIQ